MEPAKPFDGYDTIVKHNTWLEAAEAGTIIDGRPGWAETFEPSQAQKRLLHPPSIDYTQPPEGSLPDAPPVSHGFLVPDDTVDWGYEQRKKEITNSEGTFSCTRIVALEETADWDNKEEEKEDIGKETHMVSAPMAASEQDIWGAAGEDGSPVFEHPNYNASVTNAWS
jgi:hypothetical protein